MNIIILGVQIIEDSDNRGSDNRGCTVVEIRFMPHTKCLKQQLKEKNSSLSKSLIFEILDG